MADLTYDTLQRQIANRILRATFVHGQGATLAFLWAAGAGLFGIIWGLPQYAALWTAASLGFAGMMRRDALRSSKNWATAARQLIEERFTTDRISESCHREVVRKGINLFHEVLLKIGDMKRNGTLDDDVREIVGEMGRLLALQCESARQVEELERVLSLVGIEGKLSARGVKLRAENEAAIRNEVAELEAAIDLISERLETLLLQVYRVDDGGTDVLVRDEARRRSSEALDRIQRIVDARRAAAQEVIDLLTPERRGSEPTRGAGEALLSAGNGTAHPAPSIVPIEEHPPLTGNASNRASVEDLLPLVEEALRKLNNPGALASCELVDRLPYTVAAQRARSADQQPAQPTPLERAHALRDALVAAIDRLCPGSRDPTEPGAARADAGRYTVLREAYVHGIPVKTILVRNGISESTFHRYRREATLVVARELTSQERALARSGVDHSPRLTQISAN